MLTDGPDQFAALHLLGVIKLQQRDYDAGVSLITAALQVKPDAVDALANLGLALAAIDRHDEAVATFDKALAIRPDFAEVLCSRGAALGSLDRHDEALAGFDRALAIKPDYVEALYNRGLMLGNLGRHREAVESYDKALAIDPAHVKALNNRGVALGNLGRNEEAIVAFDKALAIRPDFGEALLNRGLTLADLGRHDEAVVDYDRALTIDPDHAETLFNRGTGLVSLNRPEEAIASFDKALAIRPHWADAISNRGMALVNLNRQAEAIATFRRATAIEPDHPEANCNESLAWLRLGEFRQGWPKYESRWASRDLGSQRRTFAQPLWLGGEPLRGRTILLHAEQGFGDTIQFVRYVPLVARLGARVILEVQPPLEHLLSSIGGIFRIASKGTPLPEFDVHCPLLSLPLAFGTELETIPADVPYVFPPEVHVAKWRDRLGRPRSPRIGIAWAGSPTNRNDHNRSIALGRLAAILPIPGIEFVSIQTGIGDEERALLQSHANITHVGDQLEDFADTAAVISLLDVVVSVDTSVAHLAGAMARPLWLLVPFAPDFRWMLDREDSPWYPTARLFRQPSIGDWDAVLERVRGELSEWTEKDGRSPTVPRAEQRRASEQSLNGRNHAAQATDQRAG
jgi:tetratricopeptide (TPR) repeat protein